MQESDLLEGPKRVFDVLFFAFVAVLFPFTFVSTLWGSNQNDLPRGVPWASLMIASAVLTAVALLVFVGMYMVSRRIMRPLELEQKEHLALGERNIYETL